MENRDIFPKEFFPKEEKMPNEEMPSIETPPPPVSPPPSYYSEAFPASEPKPKGNLMKIIIGAVLVVVIGTGTCLATRIWDPMWNPFRPDAEKVIIKMAEKMKEVKTMHSQMDFGINIKNGSAADIAMKFEADSDQNDPNNLKSAGNVSLVFAVEGTQLSMGLETKTIGKDSYVKLTTIPASPLLTPYLQMMGIESDQIKNQWIKLDESSLQKLSRQELTSAQKEEAQKKQEEILAKLKNLFENKKFYLVGKELPDEEINGKGAYHYVVSLNKDEIKSIIPEMFKIMREALGGDVNVLSSLSEARLKAKEARIIADMMQMRIAAEMMYDNNYNSYSGLNCNQSDISSLCEDIAEYTGNKPVIFASSQKYCSFTALSIKGYYYCIDSKLKAVTTNINPEGSGYCNGQTFVCPAAAEISDEDYKKAADEEFSKELDKFFEKVGELSGELWIGKKDDLLYRFKGEKTFDLSKFGESATGTISLKLDINLSKFNQLINIEAPGQYKRLDEILSPIFGEYGKYLGEAQTSAKDARIIADMGQLRTTAELLYDTSVPSSGSYEYLCNEFGGLNKDASSDYGQQLSSLEQDILDQQAGTINCVDSAKSYCIIADLVSSDRGRWCIDSSLVSDEIADYQNCLGNGTSNNPYRCPVGSGKFPLKEEPSLFQASILESILKMFRK